MDGRELEPGAGLLAGVGGVRELLRDEAGPSVQRDRTGIRRIDGAGPAWATVDLKDSAGRGRARCASSLEEAASDLRELDE